MSVLPTCVTVVLSYGALPEFEEAAEVGLQDKEKVVHRGVRRQDGTHEFTCEVQVRPKADGQIDFAGPFVHGAAKARFIYLSWKRAEPYEIPFVQRVKVPLAFTAADLSGRTEARADISGRKPHAREAVEWRLS
ncbi:DUF5990 family protein [Pseudomonas mosselii]|uniref:DUF5990 family protein n=1 Tax=Pseudomonas mosselii TaxID=78327 RepID=UPI0011B4FBFF|nr:DUF5990 family protein [Pseudomonas mosselii]